MNTNMARAEEEADACINQGLDASRSDRTDEALAQYRRAAELNPRAALPHFLEGAELAQLGQFNEAEAAYATALLLAPAFEMARYQLGLLQFTHERVAVGLMTWGPLFELPPSNPLQRIVHGFSALVRKDFALALACFHEGIAANRDNDALNYDIQMVIQRIESINATAPASRQDEGGGADNLHVLLANYRPHGHPH